MAGICRPVWWALTLGLSRQNLRAFVLNSLLAWDSSGAGSGDPVSVFSACTWLAFSIECAHVILSFFSKFKHFQQVWRTSTPPYWDSAVLWYLWVQAWLCREESRGLWIFLHMFWMLFTFQGLELLHPVPSVSQFSPCSVIMDLHFLSFNSGWFTTPHFLLPCLCLQVLVLYCPGTVLWLPFCSSSWPLSSALSVILKVCNHCLSVLSNSRSSLGVPTTWDRLVL